MDTCFVHLIIFGHRLPESEDTITPNIALHRVIEWSPHPLPPTTVTIPIDGDAFCRRYHLRAVFGTLHWRAIMRDDVFDGACGVLGEATRATSKRGAFISFFLSNISLFLFVESLPDIFILYAVFARSQLRLMTPSHDHWSMIRPFSLSMTCLVSE